MTTHAPMARVPFAPLDHSRLQHLASAKNRQHGLTAQSAVLNGKANISTTKSVLSTGKRPLEPSIYDDFDGENVDPAMLQSPSKRSKSDVSEKSTMPFTFTLAPSKSMPPPPTVPSRLSTPARASMPSPRSALTAPAGRSPKRKASSMLKNRRISAPFTRIDPPLSSRTDSGLPFSLDAAISGTFSKSTPKNAGATIQESMPRNWFFDIYEDTPEEEASNLMEHSTLTLDLSSDDESGKSTKDHRGKENMPPADYDAPTASLSVTERAAHVPKRVKKTEIVRRKIDDGKMDDGERSPLSDLETEYFIPEGLDKESHAVVDSTTEKSSTSSSKIDLKSLFAAPIPFAAGSTSSKTAKSLSNSLFDVPVVTANGDVKGDIIVWEDSSTAEPTLTPAKAAYVDEQCAKAVTVDENVAPVEDRDL